MKRTTKHTQRHSSPFRLILLCLGSVLASIIFTSIFIFYPIIPLHSSNRNLESTYRKVNKKTMTVLRAISSKYRADMKDSLQLPGHSIPMVSLIEDAVNLTFYGTMNPVTDANEEFDWTPMEATALHALKSGDFFPPLMPRPINQNAMLSISGSRLTYAATTNVLCTTFAPLRRNAFSSIIDKLFANQASSISSSHQMTTKNKPTSRHQPSSNATAGLCDWLVLFYEGDQRLLSELQEVGKNRMPLFRHLRIPMHSQLNPLSHSFHSSSLSHMVLEEYPTKNVVNWINSTNTFKMDGSINHTKIRLSAIDKIQTRV